MNASTGSIGVKEKQVSDMADKIKNSKTLMVASIKGLPSKQFQSIKKSIRDHADVRVAKKNIMMRALKEAGVEGMEEYVGADCALVISELDAYELAGILATKKTPVYAKAGQVAEDDIEVKDGPTDLLPGPAISELGALGLQVAVEDGKIAIKEPRVVITKGQTINEGAASIFMKLNIMPFNVGLNVSAAYDVASKKIYTELKIDPEGYTEELKQAAGKALGFAQKISYACKDTIGYLLAKANAGAKALEKYAEVEEKPAEENKKEDTEEKVEEDSTEETNEEEKPAEEEKKDETAEDKADENASTADESAEGPTELNKPEESA